MRGPAAALDARDQIMAAVADAIGEGSRLLSIGGDHFVTYSIVGAKAGPRAVRAHGVERVS